MPTPTSDARSSYRARVGAAILAFLGILLLLNWLGSRHYRRFDWTRSGLYTLSEKTKNVLKDLKTPVTVTVFMPDNVPLAPEVQELLKRYRTASPMVTVQTLDPTRNRAQAQKFVEESGVRGWAVVFRAGEKKKVVTEDQLADFDFSRARMGADPSVKSFKGEQVFTSAILTVTQTKKPKVLFVTGHGERAFEGRTRDSFSEVAEALRADNCDVEGWASLGAKEVPPGTDCLVVAGPRTSFTVPEVDVLKKYLNDGGRALLFLDVEFAPGSRSSLTDFGLEPLLAEFGLKLDNDVVIDPKNALPMFGADTIFAKSFRPHPVTKLLQGTAVVFPLARSISVSEKPPAGFRATVLVETSSDGWGETNLKDIEKKVEKDDKDVKGPVPLAVAVESAEGTSAGAKAEGNAVPDAGKTKTRLVVAGDADFAANAGIANSANRNLVTAAANWVMEREALVAIPPKAPDQVSTTLSRSNMWQLFVVIFLVLPAAAVGMGFAIWIRRRS
jgi:ABC-type uncharacterized transport system involved in gliding motility auxiliary subunit